MKSHNQEKDTGQEFTLAVIFIFILLLAVGFLVSQYLFLELEKEYYEHQFSVACENVNLQRELIISIKPEYNLLMPPELKCRELMLK